LPFCGLVLVFTELLQKGSALLAARFEKAFFNPPPFF
jgi:hypothetical protein